jgi:AraC-like DNA-binding protein
LFVPILARTLCPRTAKYDRFSSYFSTTFTATLKRVLDLSIHLFWAIRNRLAQGARLQHAPISACALWLVQRGSLNATLHLTEASGEGHIACVAVRAGEWMLIPPLQTRTIEARAEAEWISVGLGAPCHNRDLMHALASTKPWQPADSAHGEKLLQMLTTPRADDALARLEREALVRALFAWLWRERSAVALELAARRDGPPWLLRAQERARAEPSISIHELARESGWSDAAFRREWRRWTQTSPRDWLQAHRIEAARALLERTELSMSEIAYRAGFETAGQFTRAFKTRTGLAPQSFRALRREREL